MPGERILIIEDDALVQRTLRDILKYRDYAVETAGCGEDGLDKLRKDLFDVVLLDIKLPDRDGTEILKDIKALRPETIVIMVTGYPTMDTVKASIRLGALDYLPKPIYPEKLNAVIEKALQEKCANEAKAFLKRQEILVVDDDDLVRKSIGDILRNHGYGVEIVADGESALKLIEKKEISILIADLVLPGMGGMELIERAKKVSPVNFQSIVVTGYPSIETLVDSLKKGIYEYITKPVDPEKLLAAVSHCWENLRKEIVESDIVKPGNAYMMLEKKPVKCFRLFSEFVVCGVPGLCITRYHPDELKKDFDSKSTKTYWLTLSTGDSCISPTNIEKLFKTISDFTWEYKGSIVLLDGIEYLVVHNDFPRILKFVHHLRDAIVLNKARLVMPVDGDALDKQNLELLMRELNILDWPGNRRPTANAPKASETPEVPAAHEVKAS